MGNNDTWIKLFRSLIDWEWYTDSKTKSLYIHLLLKANHKDHSFKGVMVKRGSLIIGRKKLSEQLGLSEQEIRTSLKRLKSTNSLTIKTTNKYSMVSIVNYDNYQDTKSSANQQINQQANQQITNKQPQYKNDKNDKNISTTTKEKIFKNLDLIISISKQQKKEQNIITDQIDVFVNYCLSINKSWKDDEDLFSHFSSWIKKQDLNKNRNIEAELSYFIKIFNKISNKDFQATEEIRQLLIKRLDDGFTSKQMITAIKNLRSSNDLNWHKKSKFIHATPVHLLKDDNINKYLNVKF